MIEIFVLIVIKNILQFLIPFLILTKFNYCVFLFAFVVGAFTIYMIQLQFWNFCILYSWRVWSCFNYRLFLIKIFLMFWRTPSFVLILSFWEINMTWWVRVVSWCVLVAVVSIPVNIWVSPRSIIIIPITWIVIWVVSRFIIWVKLNALAWRISGTLIWLISVTVNVLM